MTDKTPIEKAAAEIAKAIEEGKYDYQEGEEFAANMAAHFRRVLSEEVPEKKPASSIYKNVDKWYRLGYNKARRDFLGKEE